MLAATLISIHNLFTLLELVRQSRTAILNGSFDSFADQFLANYASSKSSSHQHG